VDVEKFPGFFIQEMKVLFDIVIVDGFVRVLKFELFQKLRFHESIQSVVHSGETDLGKILLGPGMDFFSSRVVGLAKHKLADRDSLQSRLYARVLEAILDFLACEASFLAGFHITPDLLDLE